MYYYIGIIAILSILIGCAAVNDPETVQEISMAGFWGTILAIALCQARKRGVDGNCLVGVMLVGLFIRFGMAFVHLAVGFWFYRGQLDFPGYNLIGISVGQNFFQGRPGDTAIYKLMGFLDFMVGPGIAGMVLLSGVIGFLGSLLFFGAYKVELLQGRS